jgi:hypothetical protein
MNIVQLHERVRFWTDTVGSARFDSVDIDNAVNTAMNDIIDERYMPGRKLSQNSHFQRTQRVRDELSELVRESDSSNPGNILFQVYSSYALIPKSSFPSDYKYLLAIATYDATGKKYNCWPITYDRINVVSDNPYRRPRTFPNVKQYYNESVSGIKITSTLGATAVKAVIHYLSQATQWKYGIEYDSSHSFASGRTVIVTSESAVYNGVTYLLGSTITIAAPFLQITSGTVIDFYVNSNIGLALHEEIARKGAVNALLSIKEFDKAKALTEYFI